MLLILGALLPFSRKRNEPCIATLRFQDCAKLVLDLSVGSYIFMKGFSSVRSKHIGVGLFWHSACLEGSKYGNMLMSVTRIISATRRIQGLATIRRKVAETPRHLGKGVLGAGQKSLRASSQIGKSACPSEHFYFRSRTSGNESHYRPMIACIAGEYNLIPMDPIKAYVGGQMFTVLCHIIVEELLCNSL